VIQSPLATLPSYGSLAETYLPSQGIKLVYLWIPGESSTAVVGIKELSYSLAEEEWTE